MNLIWNRGSHISEEVLAVVEKCYNIILPDDYKRIVMENNNGRPSLNTFDTKVSKGHVFKKLLSFKTDDIETVYTSKRVVENVDPKLFPIANDPFGNLICLKEGRIVYWLHEDDSIEPIADSFTDFLLSLY